MSICNNLQSHQSILDNGESRALFLLLLLLMMMMIPSCHNQHHGLKHDLASANLKAEAETMDPQQRHLPLGFREVGPKVAGVMGLLFKLL